MQASSGTAMAKQTTQCMLDVLAEASVRAVLHTLVVWLRPDKASIMTKEVPNYTHR